MKNYDTPKNGQILLDFYMNEDKDVFGRSLEDILKYDLIQLESIHHYIQWLFPIPYRSQFVISSPVLGEKEITAFNNSAKAKRNLERAFMLMLAFYGLELTNDGSIIINTLTFQERKKVWLTRRNHNYLRLTRIMISLNLLGLGKQAIEFQKALLAIGNQYLETVGQNTIDFWASAFNHPKSD